eukprot:14669862-Alexandrium_andersonii.AAC.1
MRRTLLKHSVARVTPAAPPATSPQAAVKNNFAGVCPPLPFQGLRLRAGHYPKQAAGVRHHSGSPEWVA